jgi:hypothetical protein
MENELFNILSADPKFNITLRNYETYQEVGDLFVNKVLKSKLFLGLKIITIVNFKLNHFFSPNRA